MIAHQDADSIVLTNRDGSEIVLRAELGTTPALMLQVTSGGQVTIARLSGFETNTFAAAVSNLGSRVFLSANNLRVELALNRRHHL
ncbi:hypothetical protein E0F15_01465 [Frankia sp. B2]|uniref:hypothetical protein n=1 Tax=unclassified Frankia TaxID=2632575 RepID=UPI0004612635|nr:MULTISPECIES: hypothetical protein [unclassified Frankia]KDA41075.1 hypothetical protein BMG523Draft_04121 [Frankia sp. BMG5.23]ORT46885.1 hypothetical protein KBI5_22785 [Frankia sp. KB5]TFE35543.1 hypothetical protein E0F15_01465 [Frankia sp. B2]